MKEYDCFSKQSLLFKKDTKPGRTKNQSFSFAPTGASNALGVLGTVNDAAGVITTIKEGAENSEENYNEANEKKQK